jgi:hypothetical protein
MYYKGTKSSVRLADKWRKNHEGARKNEVDRLGKEEKKGEKARAVFFCANLEEKYEIII